MTSTAFSGRSSTLTAIVLVKRCLMISYMVMERSLTIEYSKVKEETNVPKKVKIEGMTLIIEHSN